eukprot:3374845-Amphidinium_carterae.2
MRHTETPLRRQLKLASLPSIFTCNSRLSYKIWKWLWRYLGQHFARKEQMAAIVLSNVKLLCSLSSPAVAMAAARVILGGVRVQVLRKRTAGESRNWLIARLTSKLGDNKKLVYAGHVCGILWNLWRMPLKRFTLPQRDGT